jgi:large subunit ribosomal protein L6
MSRLAKKPIVIPAGTTVSVSDDTISVKGPKGDLSRALHHDIAVTIAGNEASISMKRKTPLAKALVGTYASHVKSMVKGVNTPFAKVLILEGVGYRVEQQGENLKLLVGFSHPVLLPVPKGLSVKVEKNTLTIEGVNKELVGQFAAEVRGVKPPEPYKGKGFRYSDEVIRRKQGKKAV